MACECVCCADCHGQGTIHLRGLWFDDLEGCDECRGSGIVEICDECAEMANAKTEELKAHVSGCPTCGAAKGRVNDFCDSGRVMFYEWAQVNAPTGVEVVAITSDQWDRLVAERNRRARNAGRN